MKLISAKPVKRYNSVPSVFSSFDHLFEDFFRNDLSVRPAGRPAVNVIENEQSYTVELVAPGFQKSDFVIEVKDDTLRLAVEKKEEKTEEQPNFRLREFRSNSFERRFRLPETVNQEDISAVYDSGILKVNLNKKEVEKPATKLIEVA